MLAAKEALDRLREGNRRYSCPGCRSLRADPARRFDLVSGQDPFAVILTCADSRVPAEMIFDQGLGDLFVIRVAGNIISPSQVGSVEYALEHLGTRLVVVMGHSHCGAVEATIAELKRPAVSRCGHVNAIVDRIRPSVKPLVDQDGGEDDEQLIEDAVRAHIHASTEALRHGSDLIEELQREEGLTVVGAEYILETGEVEMLDCPGPLRKACGCEHDASACGSHQRPLAAASA